MHIVHFKHAGKKWKVANSCFDCVRISSDNFSKDGSTRYSLFWYLQVIAWDSMIRLHSRDHWLFPALSFLLGLSRRLHSWKLLKRQLSWLNFSQVLVATLLISASKLFHDLKFVSSVHPNTLSIVISSTVWRQLWCCRYFGQGESPGRVLIHIPVLGRCFLSSHLLQKRHTRWSSGSDNPQIFRDQERPKST